MARVISEYDRLALMERRVRYLLGARLRDRDQILAAMTVQDELRSSHPAVGGWNSTEAVRRLREER